MKFMKVLNFTGKDNIHVYSSPLQVVNLSVLNGHHGQWSYFPKPKSILKK